MLWPWRFVVGTDTVLRELLSENKSGFKGEIRKQFISS